LPSASFSLPLLKQFRAAEGRDRKPVLSFQLSVVSGQSLRACDAFSWDDRVLVKRRNGMPVEKANLYALLIYIINTFVFNKM
jgi:hypothetical protein